jgi:osmoprotectant transport system ATP-binding protein
MDEPFAALDPITRGALQAELLRIQQATGKTILFVTHDIDEAIRLASVVGLMANGRLAQWGTSLDLLERPADAFVAEFVGGPERALRLLSLHKVADRLRPDGAADGEPISSDASLRDALTIMTARRIDHLPVVDASGRRLGAIHAADLIR